MNFETKVYHRVAVVYADDGQRYVLDPLRGQRTASPQTFSEYFAYYDDEIQVQRYIGQAYIPSTIRRKALKDEEIAEVLQANGLIAAREFT